MLNGQMVSTSGRIRFGSYRGRVSLINFRSDSGRVIISGKDFPALISSIEFRQI